MEDVVRMPSGCHSRLIVGEAGVFVGRDAVWPGIGKKIHIAHYAAGRGEIASLRLRTLIAGNACASPSPITICCFLTARTGDISS